MVASLNTWHARIQWLGNDGSDDGDGGDSDSNDRALAGVSLMKGRGLANETKELTGLCWRHA